MRNGDPFCAYSYVCKNLSHARNKVAILVYQHTKIYNRREKKTNQWTNRERARGCTLHYKDTPVRLREYMTGLQIIGV